MTLLEAFQVVHIFSSQGQPLKLILEHVKIDDGSIAVDITAEHGPNLIFSDCNFNTMSDAIIALANNLKEIKRNEPIT